jgi:hypothetical protein
MSWIGRRATGALPRPDNLWCTTPLWTDVNDGPGIAVPRQPCARARKGRSLFATHELGSSGESRGTETSRVFTRIMNDENQPDEIRGLAMLEGEERAANLEASAGGPAKRRTRPGRARRWILLTLLAPFTILTHLAVRRAPRVMSASGPSCSRRWPRSPARSPGPSSGTASRAASASPSGSRYSAARPSRSASSPSSCPCRSRAGERPSVLPPGRQAGSSDCSPARPPSSTP